MAIKTIAVKYNPILRFIKIWKVKAALLSLNEA